MCQIYFILEWHSTCFGRSFRPSSGVQDCTYSNRHLSDRYCCLLASGYEMELQEQAFVNQILLSASIQQYLFEKCLLLYVQSWIPDYFQLVPASKQTAVSVWQMPVAVGTILNSWWWTERQSETCGVSFQNKIWYIGASGWFYYRNNITIPGHMNVKLVENISLDFTSVWTPNRPIRSESIYLLCYHGPSD
jgi:hypothetical protein